MIWYLLQINYWGSIGCGDNTNQLIPIKIIGFNNEKVVAISCEECHILALTESGHVFSWGYNCFGQSCESITQQIKKFRLKWI